MMCIAYNICCNSSSKGKKEDTQKGGINKTAKKLAADATDAPQYNFKIIVDSIVIIIRMNEYDVVALCCDQQ